MGICAQWCLQDGMCLAVLPVPVFVLAGAAATVIDCWEKGLMRGCLRLEPAGWCGIGCSRSFTMLQPRALPDGTHVPLEMCHSCSRCWLIANPVLPEW